MFLKIPVAFTSNIASQGISKKLKLLMFSRNWQIRVVFTKDCHHGWQQESLIWYNP